jgi:pimeloyl-ACP methyl ester carboxylesterase
MPLILLACFLTSILSVGILAAAGYFFWRWYEGVVVIDSAGIVHRIQEDWPLWVGLGALAWSFLGGFLIKPLLASPDKRVLKSDRSNGRTITSATGSELYVEIHGKSGAPTIIFTHGWGLDSTIWGYAVEDLSAEFEVIVWDLPGLGKSKGKVDLEVFAEDLRAVAGLASGESIFLVGHSIGGMTIQTLARNDPAFVNANIAGIVLLNTTFTNPLRTMIFSPLVQALRWPVIEPLLWLTIPFQPLAWLSAWQSYLSGSAHMANRLGFGKYVTRTQLDVTALLATRNSPAAQARGNLAMFRWDATGALSQIRVPALVIGGQVDIVTKQEASHAIGVQATTAEVTIVDEVNHMGLLERFETYNGAIKAFASRAAKPARDDNGNLSIDALSEG